MRVRYAYQDLGDQPAGNVVVVRLRGSAANVMLMNEPNFLRYGVGKRFTYVGGRYRQPAAQLPIPRDGHWYVVVDLGGHSGRAQVQAEVLTPDEAQAREERASAPASA